LHNAYITLVKGPLVHIYEEKRLLINFNSRVFFATYFL